MQKSKYVFKSIWNEINGVNVVASLYQNRTIFLLDECEIKIVVFLSNKDTLSRHVAR